MLLGFAAGGICGPTKEVRMEQNRSKFDNDPVPQSIHNAIETAEHLVEEHLYGRAYEVLVRVHAELKEHGIVSAFVAWLLAIAADTVGRLDEAIAYIAESRAIDLVFPRALSSEKVIVGRILTLLQVAGPHDSQVLLLVEALHRNFPANHPGLRLVEEKLAEAATAGQSGRERAVA